jgi:YfiH family protein
MADLLVPEWPAPGRVRALQTLRGDGCSRPPWNSFNLGDHVGDDPAAVSANRAALRARLPDEPRWLKQVHGHVVVDAGNPEGIEADAAYARRPGAVCVVMTADCLPVLFCDRAGTVVAAAHAGWRGLADGVLEATITAMAAPASDLLAWLGPAIGPSAFEVGDEVRAAFLAADPHAIEAFKPHAPGKWLADIYKLARQRLRCAGVASIYGGDGCTVSDQERFFSYRRDGLTGRMATLIWLAEDDGV